MNKLKIKYIANKEDFIKYYEWFKDIPFTDNTPEEVLGLCLTGRYHGFVGYRYDTATNTDKAVGIVIYYIINNLCFVVGLWCRENLKDFPVLFYVELKKLGIKIVRASTNTTIKDYGKRMGMVKAWTVYERKL